MPRWLMLLSPARGRGWERGLRTSIPPLLASPPSGGEELEKRSGRDNGWTSAHPSLAELLVQELECLGGERAHVGDAVKKGQVIAKAGSSGGAASPRVHFEVRRGGSKTIDPMTVLPAQ